MSRWGQGLDDLAAAAASLLQDGVVRSTPLTDPAGTLACRDAVVAQLRALVGSVSDVPRFAVTRPITVFDVTRRPGQALHQALAELPRSTTFGAAAVDYDAKNLPPYEQHWRDAARACVSLEAFVDAIAMVPDQHGWSVLRDLADLAAALPALDHGLSEAILPWLTSGQDLAVPYAMLTHPAHDAVRLCTNEIRDRVPADPPSTGTPPPMPTVMTNWDLDTATTQYTQLVMNRGSKLAVGDLRAVTRLLQFAGGDAATVLERAAPAVPGAAQAAQGLRAVAPLAEQLRATRANSMNPEQLLLLRQGTELQHRVLALAEIERRLPGGAAEVDLKRLAGPALAFATHIPTLARALEISIRETLAGGSMLVPATSDKHLDQGLSWVTARMDGPAGPAPKLLAKAEEISHAAQSIGPGVRTAQAELSRHDQATEPARKAAAAARTHAGIARAQLRTVLNDQHPVRPAPLASPLPAHPRLAPDGPVSGRSR